MIPRSLSAYSDVVDLVRLIGPIAPDKVAELLMRRYAKPIVYAAIRGTTERGWVRLNREMDLEFVEPRSSSEEG